MNDYDLIILCRKMESKTIDSNGLQFTAPGVDFLDHEEVKKQSDSLKDQDRGLQSLIKMAANDSPSILIGHWRDLFCREVIVNTISDKDNILSVLESLGYCTIISICGRGLLDKKSSAVLSNSETLHDVGLLMETLFRRGYSRIYQLPDGFNIVFRSVSSTPSMSVSAALFILRILSEVSKECLKSISGIAHYLLKNPLVFCARSFNQSYGMDSQNLVGLSLYLLAHQSKVWDRRNSPGFSGPSSAVSSYRLPIYTAFHIFEQLSKEEIDVVSTMSWSQYSVFRYINEIRKEIK